MEEKQHRKIKIPIPIIVEGKYDKIKLSSIADAHIITTDGFGIFKEGEKRLLLQKLAEKNGVIVLTDSDGAGLVIRNYLRSVLPQDRVHHLYIPPSPGKERRKDKASKEGLLGVEGMDANLLIALLTPFAQNEDRGGFCRPENFLTKSDFYEAGFSGREDSAQKRATLAKYLDLPANISANAMLEAINLLQLAGKYQSFLDNGEKS